MCVFLELDENHACVCVCVEWAAQKSRQGKQHKLTGVGSLREEHETKGNIW